MRLAKYLLVPAILCMPIPANFETASISGLLAAKELPLALLILVVNGSAIDEAAAPPAATAPQLEKRYDGFLSSGSALDLLLKAGFDLRFLGGPGGGGSSVNGGYGGHGAGGGTGAAGDRPRNLQEHGFKGVLMAGYFMLSAFFILMVLWYIPDLLVKGSSLYYLWFDPDRLWSIPEDYKQKYYGPYPHVRDLRWYLPNFLLGTDPFASGQDYSQITGIPRRRLSEASRLEGPNPHNPGLLHLPTLHHPHHPQQQHVVGGGQRVSHAQHPSLASGHGSHAQHPSLGGGQHVSHAQHPSISGAHRYQEACTAACAATCAAAAMAANAGRHHQTQPQQQMPPLHQSQYQPQGQTYQQQQYQQQYQPFTLPRDVQVQVSIRRVYMVQVYPRRKVRFGRRTPGSSSVASAAAAAVAAFGFGVRAAAFHQNPGRGGGGGGGGGGAGRGGTRSMPPSPLDNVKDGACLDGKGV